MSHHRRGRTTPSTSSSLPSQIKARHPFLELDGIRLGLWDPKDGDIDRRS